MPIFLHWQTDNNELHNILYINIFQQWHTSSTQNHTICWTVTDSLWINKAAPNQTINSICKLSLQSLLLCQQHFDASVYHWVPLPRHIYKVTEYCSPCKSIKHAKHLWPDHELQAEECVANSHNCCWCILLSPIGRGLCCGFCGESDLLVASTAEWYFLIFLAAPRNIHPKIYIKCEQWLKHYAVTFTKLDVKRRYCSKSTYHWLCLPSYLFKCTMSYVEHLKHLISFFPLLFFVFF